MNWNSFFSVDIFNWKASIHSIPHFRSAFLQRVSVTSVHQVSPTGMETKSVSGASILVWPKWEWTFLFWDRWIHTVNILENWHSEKLCFFFRCESKETWAKLTMWKNRTIHGRQKRFKVVVSTHLKNISQIGPFPQIGMKINKYLKPPPRIWSSTSPIRWGSHSAA